LLCALAFKHIGAVEIHVARDGKQLGIFSLEEINRQLAARTLSLSDLGWYEGAAGWAALSTVPGVTAAAPGGAPQIFPATVPPKALVPIIQTEPLAVLSLVLSVCGFFGFCCALFLLMPIGGVICGHIALSKVKSASYLQGRGLALSGLIVGYAVMAFWLLWILLFGGLALFSLFNEASKP
jgi:hypothetical protein